MKAVVYSQYGSADMLRLADVPIPVPADDEVLIDVHAASINSWDWDLLRGTPIVNRIGGLRTPKYPILGADVAGRIAAIGRTVTRFQPGAQVFGDLSQSHWGGLAEYVCARADMLVEKPAAMTFAQAAAIPQAAGLALQALRYGGEIQPGQTVLINGAGGGVGTFAVQMAASLGAEVTGVDSAEKLELIRSLGAAHALDYAREDFTRTGQQYDRILDVVAYRPLADYKRTLRPGGVFVMIGGPMPRVLPLLFLGPWIARREGKRMGVLMWRPRARDLETMKALCASGSVRPVIDRCYPLAEAPEAFRHLGAGRIKGKAVITVAHSHET